jgi:hypothetical protein
VHDEAQPRGAHMAQSTPLDDRTGGGAGPLDRGRGAVVNILYRLYAKRRRELGYDDHTYAAAGVAPGDRHEHGSVTNAHGGATAPNPASDPDVSGDDRPRPYLLHPRADADAEGDHDAGAAGGLTEMWFRPLRRLHHEKD